MRGNKLHQSNRLTLKLFAFSLNQSSNDKLSFSVLLVDCSKKNSIFVTSSQ